MAVNSLRAHVGVLNLSAILLLSEMLSIGRVEVGVLLLCSCQSLGLCLLLCDLVCDDLFLLIVEGHHDSILDVASDAF